MLRVQYKTTTLIYEFQVIEVHQVSLDPEVQLDLQDQLDVLEPWEQLALPADLEPPVQQDYLGHGDSLVPEDDPVWEQPVSNLQTC